MGIFNPIKPKIDLTNSIASGLVGSFPCSEGTGTTTTSLITGTDILTFSGDAKWTTLTGLGIAIDATSIVGTSTGAILTTPSASLQQANTVTIFWYGTVHDDGTGNIVNNPSIFGMPYDNANNSPYACYDIERRSNFSSDIRFAYNNAGTYHSLDISGGLIFDTPISLAITISGSNVIGYKNGIQVGAVGSGVTSISYGATTALQMNRHITSTSDSSSSKMSVGYIWNRALTANEILLMHENPYRMYISTQTNNHEFVTAGNGMSVTEKIR